MHGFKPILVFLMLAVSIYIVAVIRWPGVREAYRDLYLFAGKSLFGRYGEDGVVLFKAHDKGPANDAKITMGRESVAVGLPVVINTGQVGYTPTAELVALIIATPVSWRRRAVSLLLGLLLVNAFVMGRLWILLMYGFAQDSPVQLYDLSPFWHQVVSWLHEYFFMAPEGSFVVPAIIWVVVTFSRKELATLVARIQSVAPADSSIDAATTRRDVRR